MIKDKSTLYLPKPKIDKIWALEEREMRFLDLVILRVEKDEECYRMVFHDSKKTALMLKKMASACKNSADGKAYIAKRTTQLLSHLYPDEKESEADNEKFMADFKANFKADMMRKMWESIKDAGSETHSDALKAGYQKLMKDFESEKISHEPPLRILAESCASCRYKLFVENSAIDECSRCRYKEKCNIDGIVYDHKTMLKQS